METDTGTWVGPADTGTSPTKTDSDSDGLTDNVDTNTKVFVSEMDTGTNPNVRDSDEDGFNDAPEVTLGSDPTDPDSVPASDKPVLVAHYEFEVADNLGLDSSGMGNGQSRQGKRSGTNGGPIRGGRNRVHR